MFNIFYVLTCIYYIPYIAVYISVYIHFKIVAVFHNDSAKSIPKFCIFAILILPGRLMVVTL